MVYNLNFVRTISPLAAVVAGLLLLTGCSRKPAPPARKPAATQPAYNPASPAAEALRQEFLKKYDLKGRVSMIEFGTVDCKLSGQGLDGMVMLQKLDIAPGLSFVRVEQSGDTAAADAYYKKRALKFPVHRDPSTELARAFESTSLPSFILVDKFGRVRYRGSYPDNEAFADWIVEMQEAPGDMGPAAPLFGVVTLEGAKLLAATKLPGLDGETVALDQVMGPEGMVAVFIDTTCPFSGQALGDMPKVAPTLTRFQINSIVVNIDGSADVVKKYFGNKLLGAPVIYDPTDATMKRWNIQSVPTVVYINPDKEIVYNGVAVWADVANAIEESRGLPPGTIKFSARGTSYG